MIGHKTALLLIIVFIGFIVTPPVHQLCLELKRTGRWRFLALFQEKPTHASLRRFEETLATESDLGAKARLFFRESQLSWLGQGNDKIVVGHGGFLFFRQELEMAAGPGFLHRSITGTRGIADEPKGAQCHRCN